MISPEAGDDALRRIEVVHVSSCAYPYLSRIRSDVIIAIDRIVMAVTTRMSTCLISGFLFIASSYATSQTFGDECQPYTRPVTTHPDAPVARPGDSLNLFDWRRAVWPVNTYQRVSHGGRIEVADIDSIPAPSHDVANRQLPGIVDPDFLNPDLGWELIRIHDGVKPGNDRRFRTPCVTALFYNRYSGIVRPMFYFVELHDKRFDLLSCEMSIHASDGPTPSFVIVDALNEEALDSNMFIDIRYTKHRSIAAPLEVNERAWIYEDFPTSYDPCACNQATTVFFTNIWRSVESVVRNDSMFRTTYGPYRFADVGTYTPGSRVDLRSDYLASRIPFYDAPLGLWNLLRTPRIRLVQHDSVAINTGEHTVSGQLLLQESLQQTVNDHVFRTDVPIRNVIAYILTIHGEVTDMTGLRRVNDSLYVTDDIDAECANAIPYRFSFVPHDTCTITSARLAIRPTLHSRYTDRIGEVSPEKFFASILIHTDSLAPSSVCAGVVRPTPDDLASFCSSPVYMQRSRSRRANLPLADTIMLRQEIERSLHVYPNPTVDDVTIRARTSIGEQIDRIWLVDLTGKTIAVIALDPTMSTSSTMTFRTADIASGTYHLLVTTSQRTMGTTLVIRH